MHLTAKFHHPTFNRSEVIVLTNEQTDKQTRQHALIFPPAKPVTPGGTQWHRLLLRAAYGLATAHALLCIVNWDDSAVFVFVPCDLDLYLSP